MGVIFRIHFSSILSFVLKSKSLVFRNRSVFCRSVLLSRPGREPLKKIGKAIRVVGMSRLAPSYTVYGIEIDVQARRRRHKSIEGRLSNKG
jgi:hypothetical protein